MKTRKERTPSAGSAGWAISSCSATRRADALAELGELARLVGHDREAERLGVDERAERAAVGDVDPQLAEARDLDRRVEVGRRTTGRSRT